MSADNPTQIVEHIVLFKVKPDVNPATLPGMVDCLNSLAPLSMVLHLSAGPVTRCRSSSHTFTHILHSRFASKEDLDKFYADPDHHVVINQTKPFFEDIMAVDWFHAPSSITIPPGSTMRVTFLKLKENLEEDKKNELLGIIGGIQEKFPAIEVHSFGENNSPARGKGFSIVSVAVFKGVDELESFYSEWEAQVSEHRERVKDKVEEALVLDFVLP